MSVKVRSCTVMAQDTIKWQALVHKVLNFWVLQMQRISWTASINIYAVLQDTQSVLMSEFIQHLC